MSTPREFLYDRAARLRRSRWLVIVAVVLMLALLWALTAIDLSQVPTPDPIIWWVCLAICAVTVAAAVLARRNVKAQAAAMRNVGWHSIEMPSPWPALDCARESYKLLTGETPPEVAFVRQRDAGVLVDAELFLETAEGPDGQRHAVMPFVAPSTARPVVAFSEGMLDTFRAEELVAVMLHLVHRLRLIDSTSARRANGVLEADCQALLVSRDHVALLGAIQKTTKHAETRLPMHGFIFFSDQEVNAATVRGRHDDPVWVVQDRLAALREHLGAAALDVPKST